MTEKQENPATSSQRLGTPRILRPRSRGSTFAKTIPAVENRKAISRFRPTRIWKLVAPVVVQMAALPLKCRTSAFAVSFTQSKLQKAIPARTVLQLRFSISAA